MTFTSAAHACVVEVDVETGFVKILRWISAEDCGTVINPAVVEGQIAGGLAQAIGTVLLEDMQLRRARQPDHRDLQGLPAARDRRRAGFRVRPRQHPVARRRRHARRGRRRRDHRAADPGQRDRRRARPFGEIAVDLPLTPAKILDLVEGRDISGTAATRVAEPKPAPMPQAEPATELPPVDATLLPAGVPQAAVNAPTTIDGEWAMTIAAAMGGQEMTAVFRTEGDRLTGELLSDQGDQAFEGTVAGNRLTWEMKVEKPMKLTLKYDLVVEGDALSGKMKMGMLGSAKVTGTRL